MESQPFEKQMFSTNRRDKIFNVRKVPYKQFDNQKYLKSNFSPFQKKQHLHQPSSSQAKKTEYLPSSIASSAYKQLTKKYQNMRDELQQQKQKRLQKLKQREDELSKYSNQRERLALERQKLINRRQQIKHKIQQLRERNEAMRQEQNQRNEQIRIINMEYLRNMIMAMRYQNGVEIDTDNMSYEQLLQLEEKMGSVSKGITEEQITKIERVSAAQVLGQLCSICYYNVKQGEQLNKLPCAHLFHVDCIKEWLLKERTCPLCKQEIYAQTLHKPHQ